MKKKLLALLLGAALATTLLAGCGDKKTENKDTDKKTENTGDESKTDKKDLKFEIIVKSYQSSYWQAAVKGVESKADELGVSVKCTGPNAESDIADQVTMLKNAISNNPDGIGLAACDQSACLDALNDAMAADIPVVCFDSGIPDAPAGSVYSTVATDNKGAGAVAAEHLYAALKDTIASATSPVRIGEVNQEATSESITSRGLGFIDKFIELAKADGKTVAVTGNEYYVNNCSEKGDEASADIIIEVAVPAQTTTDLCKAVAEPILNKKDTIGIFGSNQVAAEGILQANANLNVLGSKAGEGKILAAGFDAGSVIKGAITDGTMFGAVTQSPLAMGETTVEVLVKIANGESVSDVPTEGYWYDSTNMEDDSIKPNLYD